MHMVVLRVDCVYRLPIQTSEVYVRLNPADPARILIQSRQVRASTVPPQCLPLWNGLPVYPR